MNNRLMKLLSGAVAMTLAFTSFGLIKNDVYAANALASQSHIFEDPYFRQYLKENFDKNNDDFLSESEINAVETIDISNNSLITNIQGTYTFTNLKTLILKNTNITFISLRNPNLQVLRLSGNDNMTLVELESGCEYSSLKEFTVNNSSTTECSIPAMPNLEILDITNDQITSLSLLLWPNLKSVKLNCYNLEELITSASFGGSIFGKNTNLTSFEINQTQLTSLDLTCYPNLEKCYIDYPEHLTTLNLSSNTKLKDLTLRSLVNCTNLRLPSDLSNIQRLDLAYFRNPNVPFTISKTTMPNLSRLYIRNCNFDNKTLNLSNLDHLYVVSITGTNLTSINLTGCSEIRNITATNNQITNYDLSDLIHLSEANISGGTVTYPIGFGTPTSTPVVTRTPEYPEGISNFCSRLYTVALNRNLDEAGQQYWCEQLIAGRTGADVAHGFFFCDEFNASCTSNTDYITRLYKTFMNREPDTNGINYWLALMSNGTTREAIFQGFVNSNEWATICADYGINSGGTGTPNNPSIPSEGIYAFTSRLYTTCLNRTEDSAGVDYWANELNAHNVTGTSVAHEFFFCEEFTNSNVSNEEFINRLYLTFMNRSADQSGYDYWLNAMNAGATRENVFNAIAASNEFSVICAGYGIIQ